MNGIFNILILLALVTLPMDSFPFILPSVYRPLSIVFLVVAMPMVLMNISIRKKRIIKKTNLLIVIFYIYTLTMSLIFSVYKYKNYGGFVEFSITLTIGLITFFSFDYYLSFKRNLFPDNDKYIEWIFEIIAKIYIFVIFVGIIEVLVIVGILPYGIKEVFMRYIAGRGTVRIQLMAGETSWAAMHLVFVMPIYYHLMKKKLKYKKYFYISLALFLFMFSLQGYLIIIFGFFFYLLVEKKYHKLLKYSFYLILMIVCFYFIWNVFQQLLKNDVYYLTRINKLANIKNVGDLLYLDGSVFIRTVFPAIGVLVFKDNFIFGVGGGNFRFELGRYITEYFPNGVQFGEVQDAVNNNIGNSKNLFTRLLSETGFIGFSIYLVFLYELYKKIRKSFMENSGNVKIWFLMLLAIFLQFDSFAYIHAWLLFAVINNLTIITKK